MSTVTINPLKGLFETQASLKEGKATSLAVSKCPFYLSIMMVNSLHSAGTPHFVPEYARYTTPLILQQSLAFEDKS